MGTGYFRLPISSGSVVPPSTSAQSIFTGATIPLTYKDNSHEYENTYTYESQSHNITITGLDDRATITGNGTKTVTVAFIVTSATSSLKNFTISCTNSFGTRTFTGMHAHYGTTCTGILTFAYKNITKDGSEGTIGTNYLFIEKGNTTLPLFGTTTTVYGGIYSYQLLNVLIGNYNSTSIGNNFLRYCYSFNQPLTIPSGVSSIGQSFLGYCYSFNQPIDLSNITTIGGGFLYYCYAFNQPIDLSNVTTLGNNFLYYCYAFNQPIDLSNVTTLGSNFLSYCYSFNQLLVLSGLTTIAAGFLSYCYSFNQPIDLSNITTLGTSFLSYCYSFNQPLDLSNVTTIGDSFLSYCYSFNQPIDLSNVTTIGSSFLYYCHSFNQPLTVPANVNSIGTSFLYNAFGVSTIVWETTVYPTDDNSLSQTLNTKPNATYGAGIVIYGSKSANLKTALPDRTSTPYRKLIDGEA